MRKRKYNNKPTVLDGYRFDSIGESNRYQHLKLLLKAGEIADLEIHPRFPLDVQGQRICTYEADFKYKLVNRGTIVVEDYKGVRTALFLLKKKLMKAVHGIDVIEVTRKPRSAVELFDHLDGVKS